MAVFRNTSFHCVALALLCASLEASGPAFAEEKRGEVELPAVTVTGSEPCEERLREPTSALSSVTPKQGESASAAELAARTPGVTLREYGLNQSVSLSIRGSTANQVSLRLDGIPLGSATGAGVDLSTLPAPFIERLTIVRGAVGSRYGSGSMGGALLIDTRRPEQGTTQLFGEARYGSFDSRELSLGANVALAAETSALIAAFAKSSEGDFPYSYDGKPGLPGMQRVRGARANNAELRGALIARIAHLAHPSNEGALPMELLLELDAGRRGLPGMVQAPSDDARQEDSRFLAAASIRPTLLGFDSELKAGAHLSELSLSLSAAPLVPQRTTQLFSELTLSRMVGSRNLLELGLGAAHETLTTEYGPFAERRGAQSHERPALFASVSDEFVWGPLTLLPSARAERVGDDAGLSPRAGASLALPASLTLRGNLGQSFRAPSQGELYLEQGLFSPNENLTPERATFADMGLAFSNSGLSLSLSGFSTFYDDLISYEQTSLQRARPFNIGKGLVRGAELDASWELGALGLEASYTFTSSHNRINEESYFGKELPFHPRHRLFAGANLSLDWMRASFSLDATGEQWTNRANTERVDAMVRPDAGIGFRLLRAPSLWLHASVKNLADAQGHTFYGYPLAGRSFWLALRAESTLSRKEVVDDPATP